MLRKLGVTEEFTRGDKFIFGLKYVFFFWQFGVGFLGFTLAYAIFGFMQTDDAWATWWTLFLWITGITGVVATVWFLIGGFKDLFAMFAQLKSMQRDADDDGSVAEHLGKPADDEPAAAKVRETPA